MNALTCRATPIVLSPFNGDWEYSMPTIRRCLNIKRIEDQPVAKATIRYPDYTDVIEAGPGKHYGLASLYYCLMKYGSNEEKAAGRFEVTPPMVAEVFLYYGPALWSDDENQHPSIWPFRAAAQGAKVHIELVIEPHP